MQREQHLSIMRITWSSWAGRMQCSVYHSVLPDNGFSWAKIKRCLSSKLFVASKASILVSPGFSQSVWNHLNCLPNHLHVLEWVADYLLHCRKRIWQLLISLWSEWKWFFVFSKLLGWCCGVTIKMLCLPGVWLLWALTFQVVVILVSVLVGISANACLPNFYAFRS